MTAEIALALALLVGAGLVIQDFLRQHYAGFGIDSNQVLTANLSLSGTRYEDPPKQAAFFQEAIRGLEALPGVISAGATSTLVPGDGERIVTFSVDGQPGMPRTERASTAYFAISPDYLRTLRVPLIRGRSLLSSDTPRTPPVALVNQAFVQRFSRKAADR